MDNQTNNIETAIETGAALSAPRTEHGGVPYITAPDNYSIKSLEQLLLKPVRKRAAVVVTDTPSFIFYVKKHGNKDATVIYAEVNPVESRFKLKAILDDHGTKPESTAWRDHTCTLTPSQTVEWGRWNSQDKTRFNQSDFAAWLEDNLADIASVDGMPTGRDILEMSLAFVATADKRLRSKINLQSGGVQFEFVDDEDKGTRTKMKVFERFTLGLPVFDGSTSAYQVEARLKYREKEGRVVFWYELIRPDRVFKQAVIDEMTAIRDATKFNVISGQP